MTDEVMKADNETRTFIEAVSLVEDAGWVVLRPEQVATPAQTKGDDLGSRLHKQRRRINNRLNMRVQDAKRWPLGDDDALELEAINILLYDAQHALKAAQAEIARMREALERISEDRFTSFNDAARVSLERRDIARTALTPKEPT